MKFICVWKLSKVCKDSKTQKVKLSPLWPLGVLLGLQALATAFDLFKLVTKTLGIVAVNGSTPNIICDTNNVTCIVSNDDAEEDERVVFVPKTLVGEVISESNVLAHPERRFPTLCFSNDICSYFIDRPPCYTKACISSAVSSNAKSGGGEDFAYDDPNQCFKRRGLLSITEDLGYRDDQSRSVRVTINDEKGWPNCNICMCKATDPTSAVLYSYLAI